MNLNSFEQIYIDFRKYKTHYKISHCYLYEIAEQLRNSSDKAQLLFVHIQLSMVKNPSKTWQEVQTITLDYKDQVLFKKLGGYRTKFYSAIKELIDMQLLFKVANHKYIVNPYYMTVATKQQLHDFKVYFENKHINTQAERTTNDPLPPGVSLVGIDKAI